MKTASMSQKLDSVQALRGLAAILVLFLHVAGVQKTTLAPDNLTELGYLTGFWNQGYVGVDMFFIISGFIMVYVTHNFNRNPHNIGRFLYKRATRIYPLWWIFAALMALYFLITYGQAAPPDQVPSSQVGTYIFKSFALLPQKIHPVLGVGWTLIHEMFFYLVFATCLFFQRKWLPILLGIWVGVIGAVALIDLQPSQAQTWVDLAVSPFCLEFIAGAFAALLLINNATLPARLILVLSGLGLIVTLSLGLDVHPKHFTWARVIVYTLPCAGLVFALAYLERYANLKVPKWMVAIGDASYSLYLSHMLVLLSIRRIWQMAESYLPEGLRFTANGYWDNIAFALIAIFCAVVFSLLSYRFIEKPLINVFRR